MSQIAYVNRERFGGFAEFNKAVVKCSIGKRKFLGNHHLALSPEEIIREVEVYADDILFAKELAVKIRLNRHTHGLVFIGLSNPSQDVIEFEFHWVETSDIPNFMTKTKIWIDEATLGVDLT